MSHFLVLVVGDDVDDALEPFQENNMGDCPSRFLEFEDRTDEVNEEWAGLTPEVRKKFKHISDFAIEEMGYVRSETDGDRFGFYENPNAKWDWYEVGGRYHGRLVKRDGTVCNTALISELDREAMSRARREKAVEWWAEYQAGKDSPHARIIHGVEDGETFEHFQDRVGRFSTFAVLKDGAWHERGSMGWWGVVSDEKDKDVWDAEVEKLISDLPPSTRITMVDCHI